MVQLPVILIFDVGKTNKKIILFDEKYNIVFEESIRFEEINDEDGFPCEDIEALTKWIKFSVEKLLVNPNYNIKAINFSAYGASFVYVDNAGKPLLPLYNYLKPYPEHLLERFFNDYGSQEEFTMQTASPLLGSLNSGLQLYRIKYENSNVFAKIKYALHLPQYLSYIITQVPISEITSIGCHTNLWDFKFDTYHEWVSKEGVSKILPPIFKSDACINIEMKGKNILVGVGLHDSSSALIPYQASFHEPFILLSTGTWCISLNPFNYNPLSKEEIQKDCLSYLTYQGTVTPVREPLGHLVDAPYDPVVYQDKLYFGSGTSSLVQCAGATATRISLPDGAVVLPAMHTVYRDELYFSVELHDRSYVYRFDGTTFTPVMEYPRHVITPSLSDREGNLIIIPEPYASTEAYEYDGSTLTTITSPLPGIARTLESTICYHTWLVYSSPGYSIAKEARVGDGSCDEGVSIIPA